MQGYNCIIVYNKEKDKILFCKRTKNPYMGLYNLVGGKIEQGEDGFKAAYRELREETGITKRQTKLFHMMDFTYYNQNCYVEVYVGVLTKKVKLKEELHPLVWLNDNDDFFSTDLFAGEGNIGHMIEQVKRYGIGISEKGVNEKEKAYELDLDSICIGVDGCKGGWIGATIDHGELQVNRFNHVSSILEHNPKFNELFIDMIIGLPSNRNHIRPDTFARKIIKERASTVFPAPSRQAVFAETIDKAYEENIKALGKKFTPLTYGVFTKIRQIDTFLQENPQYKNVMKESHPEVCFALLNGKTVLTKKTDIEGIEERIGILNQYLPDLNLGQIVVMEKNYKCTVDDILDAICLAVAANLSVKDGFELIPYNPMEDETGLKMQMVVPLLEK